MSGGNLVVLVAVIALHVSALVGASGISPEEGIRQTMEARRARQNLNRFWRLTFLTPPGYFPHCGPSRDGRPCDRLVPDSELLTDNLDMASLTERQLKALCNDGRTQQACYMNDTECIPGKFLPVAQPIQTALEKLWEICDQPNLYQDYLIAAPCYTSVRRKFSEMHRRGFSAAELIYSCPYVAATAGISAVKELARIDVFSWSSRGESATANPESAIKPSEIMHGACCAGKALVECAITTVIEDSCTSDAVTIIRAQLDTAWNALNCSSLTATRPCPLIGQAN